MRMSTAMLVSLILISGTFLHARAQDYGSTDPTELAALFDILGSANPDIDWKSEFPDPCYTWQQGIFCLPDNDTGALHAVKLEFGNLTDYDNIIPCSSRASIHPSIGKLPYLESLQFFHCFTKVPATIPAEVGMLQELQVFTIQDNEALVGTLPRELGDLTNLQRLIITQTGVGGPIPEELGNLSNLQQLDLSRNGLQGSVPSTLNSLSVLQIMDFAGNSLSGSLPSLGGMKTLVKMVMSNNLLNGSIPNDMGLLTSLTYLDLSYNNLSGGIPPSFANLKNLENLFLDHNCMGTLLPDFLGFMVALSRVTLAKSGYVGEIPSSYGNMANLRVLVLKENMISGVIPAALGSLPHIYHMDLSRNHLTGPIPFSSVFVEKMGSNLLMLNNTGLCLPHGTLRGSVATMGVDTCSNQETALLNRQADSPTESPQGLTPAAERPTPIHSNGAARDRRFVVTLLSVLICALWDTPNI